MRARWATIANEALLKANVQARIDHRSLDAQGIDREPVPHIPVGARHTEARGKRSEIAEKIRAAYRVRVQARLARTADRAPAAHSASNLEEIRREAQQSWLRLRQTKLEKLPAQPSASRRIKRAPMRSRSQMPDTRDAMMTWQCSGGIVCSVASRREARDCKEWRRAQPRQ